MRIAIIITVLLTLTIALSADTLEGRIFDYAGENAKGLVKLLHEQKGDTLRYCQFVLENASDMDLASLTPDFVLRNTRLAMKSRELAWAQEVPEDVFLHFVLPPRVSQEPFQNWRGPFYEELSKELEGVTDIGEAITRVNIWCAGKMRFEPTSGRDQAPLTTCRRGYGRCEEMMILFIAAARSVGIPARTASAAFWSFTDNNHAWTEVWTPDGWTFIGAAEPANRLAEAWFTRATQRAPLMTSHAYGDYRSPRAIETHLNVTTLATTDIYAPTHQHRFIVKDEEGRGVGGAEVTLYAVSYGGLFPLQSLKADEDGVMELPLGCADVAWSAQKGMRFGMGLVDGTADGEHEIVIRPDYTFSDSYVLHFVGADETVLPESEEAILPDFDLRKQVAELTRDRWLRDQRHTRDFLRFFPLQPQNGESEEDFVNRRDDWLAQCERLAGAADDWLHVLDQARDDAPLNEVLQAMLADWDIKELIELPDTTAITERAAILVETRDWWAVPDSIWRANVLNLPFPRVPCPENGWAQPLHERVLRYRGKDIASTVANIDDWLNAKTRIDTTLRYTYFTGSPDPLQWLNMRNISESGRMLLQAYALNSLGVPLRYRGFLEYWDDGEWISLERAENAEEPVARTDREIVVRLMVDGRPVSPKPWENLLLGSLTEDGLYYVWFDESVDSLDATLSWSAEEDVQYLVMANVRNDNGDACVRLQSIDENTTEQTVELTTPQRRGESPVTEPDGIALAASLLGGAPDGLKLVYVLGRVETEPQQRMVEQLRALMPDLAAAGAHVVVWVEGRRAVTVDGAEVLYGRPVAGEELDSEAYPLVYLFDADGKVLYQSRGYNLSATGQIRNRIQ